jgi:hypothetical protein
MVSDELGRRNYTLLLNDGTKDEFLAADAADALKRVQTLLPKGGSASLMEDGAPLAEITYSPEGFWEVSKRAPS